jgi:hypothetical protein
VQSHKHAAQQGYATQSEAESDTRNPHTGQETGLNNFSQEPGETVHRSPASLHSLVSQVPEQRQGRGLKAPEGLDRHRHEGQGGGHLTIRMPLGGAPSSGRKPGGTRSAHSKGGSRRVDDGNVTHHKPAQEHEHDISLGPGSKGRGDTKRVRGAGGGHRARTGGCIGRQRRSSDTAPTCRDKVVTPRPLQSEAGAGERVIGVTREDGGPAVAPEGGGFRRPGRQVQAEDDTKSESDRVRGKEVGMVSNQMEVGRQAQE